MGEYNQLMSFALSHSICGGGVTVKNTWELCSVGNKERLGGKQLSLTVPTNIPRAWVGVWGGDGQ